ncbi:MAG: zinc carboxypeptidase, partial [Bacteroidota bacterium]
YPVFSGAIGMTYEQGGGGAGGLAVINETSDTLTLYDRAIHHYTTGLSTVETAAGNAAKLVTEFQNFYKSSAANANDYKAYIIKNNAADAGRIYALLDLFKKNKIEFGTANNATARGFSYNSGKEENFSIADGDIVISAAQQKGTLLKVLFEPQTKLADSATYDITAWAMPYVYGVQAYATRQAVSTSGNTPATAVNNSLPDAYGYAIPWHGVQSVKLVSALLQKGIKLRVGEQPFTTGNKQFERGAVIVLKTSNQYVPHLWDTVRQLANKFSIQLSTVATGFVDKGYDFGSDYVKPLLQRRVAMLTGEGVSSLGAGEVWHFFEQVIDYPITLINANDAGNVNWSNYDVLIMPDGNYRFLNDKPQTDALKSWVQGGGKLIALERAVTQLAKQDWSIKLKKADETDSKDVYAPLRKYEDRERDEIPNITPGSIFRVELDNTHPLAFGFPKYYYTLKQDDAIYDFIKEDGWNVGVIKKEKQVAGFVGSKLQNRLQDGLLFGVQNLGRGTITYLADDVLFRSFWENGKLLFSNAVFMVGQ